ncbi:heterogeneous nuclear ribonucleoprotein L-like isoform X1 [Vespula squamosa]|uniref:Heterogeneous nuclear ribonucleoprotein L-like isoform X1 n=1 Tax=Vespula squamosa TaxID=30214 RepID=A0ABD1ZU26_VESSQ
MEMYQSVMSKICYREIEEVLHAISAPSGQVQRIVIFKKNGVQAMIFHTYTYICISIVITFDSVESATRAKETLHGADIYSGCCTLKIDFAKLASCFPVGAYAKRAELLEVPQLDVMLGKTHFGMALFIGSVNVRGGTN